MTAKTSRQKKCPTGGPAEKMTCPVRQPDPDIILQKTGLVKVVIPSY